MPRGMMIVTMMTSSSAALSRATVVSVGYVVASLYLMNYRVTERSWTAFPFAPDFAILTSTLDTLHLSVRVDSRMPLHAVLIRTTERVLAAAGSENLF